MFLSDVCTSFDQSVKLKKLGLPMEHEQLKQAVYVPTDGHYFEMPFWTLSGLMMLLPILKHGEDGTEVPFLSKDNTDSWTAGYMVGGTTEIVKDVTGTTPIDAVVNLIETMCEEDMFFMDTLKEQRNQEFDKFIKS